MIKPSYDSLMYGVCAIAPITNMPQLLKIWIERDASGVSAVSWALFAVLSITWIPYGFMHKDKHIVLMYVALTVLQISIATGAVLYG